MLQCKAWRYKKKRAAHTEAETTGCRTEGRGVPWQGGGECTWGPAHQQSLGCITRERRVTCWMAPWKALLPITWYPYCALCVFLILAQPQKYCSKKGIPQTASCMWCMSEKLPHSIYPSLVRSHLDRFLLWRHSSRASIAHIIDYLDAFSIFSIFFNVLSEADALITHPLWA